MKKFTLFIIKTLMIAFLIAIILDTVYTIVYTYSDIPRTKVQQARSFHNQEFDYILLGSSRVIHHIDPVEINSTWHKKGINLGYAAAQSNELYMILQTLVSNNNKIDTLFVQVDNNWNSEAPNELARVSFMPFLRESSYKSNYLSFGTPFTAYYYIPFYRYIMNEPKIGLREVILNFIAKRSKADRNLGFIGTPSRSFGGDSCYNYTLSNRANRNFAKIDSVCHKHNIHVCYFTAPYYRLQGSNAILNKYLEDYKDFSTAYDDIKMFNDALHLNSIGAEQFTKDFGAHYFGHCN